MTSHPPEPAAEWPPSPEGRPAGHGPWPALPEYPPRTGYPQDGYPGDGYPSMPDYPPASGYPSAPGHARGGFPTTEYLPNGYPTAGFPATPAAPPQPGNRPAGTHPAVVPPAVVPPGVVPPGAQGPWVLEDTPVIHDEYVYANAGPAIGENEAQWGMLAYLAVPFFGFVVPVAVYLLARRRSRWLRAHAAQALNVWLTVVLYDLSAVIMGAMLALDTRQVALAVVVPLVLLLWLVMLTFLLRAAGAASRGQAYTIPRWLCSTMVR